MHKGRVNFDDPRGIVAIETPHLRFLRQPILLRCAAKDLHPAPSWVQEHERKSNRQHVQDSWLLGYVNAVSGMLEIPGVEDVSGPFHNIDLVMWIDDYCSSHPEEPIIRAADALMRDLARRAQ